MLNEILFNQIVDDIETIKEKTIMYLDMEKSGEEKQPINTSVIGIPNRLAAIPTISFVMKNQSLNNIIIKTIKRDESEDIILKELLELIISTSNTDNRFLLDDITNVRKVLGIINNATNKIAYVARALPNIIILSQKIYDILLENNYIDNLKRSHTILINPLAEYDNKIFLFRKDNQIHQNDFILMTDTNLLLLREAKIKKIRKIKSNVYMNYSLVNINRSNIAYGLIEIS